MKRSRLISAAGALCLVTSLVPAAAASASEAAPTPEDVAAVVVNAAADAGVSAASAAGELELSPDPEPSGGVVVSSDGLAPLTIPLPNGLSLDAAVTTDSGAVVYGADQSGVDVSVEEVPQGVRVSTVLWDGSKEAFSYSLPEGVEATPQPDGSLTLTRTGTVEAEGTTVEVTATIGSIEPAWAVDATGAAAFAAGCLLATGAMVYTAGVAQNSSPKRCLEQFMTFVPLSGVIVGVPWYGTYACK